MPTRPFYVNQLSGGSAPVPVLTSGWGFEVNWIVAEQWVGGTTFGLWSGGTIDPTVPFPEVWDTQMASPIAGNISALVYIEPFAALTGPCNLNIRINGGPPGTGALNIDLNGLTGLHPMVVSGPVAVAVGDLLSAEFIITGIGFGFSSFHLTFVIV